MINKERLGKHSALTATAIIMLIVVLTVAICGCNKTEASNHRMRMLDGKLMYGIYVDENKEVRFRLPDRRGESGLEQGGGVRRICEKAG